MTDFLIKSTLAMGVLLGIYYILFEREKMHRFNRFYLLGALLFSFIVPFISLSTNTPSVVNTASITLEEVVIGSPVTVKPTLSASYNYTQALWFGYLTISILLLFRFTKNSLYLIGKAKKNQTVKYQKATLVLVGETTLPYTFFNYIFVNKDDYMQQKIECELYTHELTHIRQRHTLDIVFIEILKVIFWFNPVLYIYKKAIQLNHEFLADESVVITHDNVISYQNLLLKKAVGARSLPLASNLNFSITKKRLIMMTKTTSRSNALLKKIIVFPLLAGVVFITYSHTPALKNIEIDALPTAAQDAYNKLTEDKPAQSDTKPAISSVEEQIPLKQPLVKQDTVKDHIYKVNELTRKAEYPGGLGAFYRYVNQNFRMPENLDGTAHIYVSFIIEKDGRLSDIKVIRSPNMDLSVEAIRLLNESEKWIPAELNEKKVRTIYNLPITVNGSKPKSTFLSDSKIDSDKMKAIEVNHLTEFEKSTLKNLDPEKYNDKTLKEYKSVKISYVNENGNLVSQTTYEKHPDK